MTFIHSFWWNQIFCETQLPLALFRLKAVELSLRQWTNPLSFFFPSYSDDGFLPQQPETFPLSQLLQHLLKVLMLGLLSRTLVKTLTSGGHHTAEKRPSVVSSAAGHYSLWKLCLWNRLLPSADCQWMPDSPCLLSFTKATVILSLGISAPGSTTATSVSPAHIQVHVHTCPR